MIENFEGEGGSRRPDPGHHLAVSEEIADRLREDIVLGRLQPGSFLREADLARKNDVSRGPIREALKQLEREGIVISRRNKGFTVVAFSAEDIDEIYEVRMSLEALAVRQACQRRQLKDLAAMARTLDELADLGLSAHPLRMAELDVQFHRQIYAATHNSRLQACWRMMESQIFKAMVSRNVTEQLFSEVFVMQHQHIRSLIAARDEAQAVAAIEAHLRQAYDRLKAAVEAPMQEIVAETGGDALISGSYDNRGD